MSVVYITTNLLNGKKYIGSDSNNDKYYYGSGVNLKKAIKKYGKRNFKKDILWKGNYKFLKEMEEYWLEYFNVEKSQLFYNATNKVGGSAKGKSHNYKRPILQYDLEGNFIKEWKSYTEASRSLKIKTIGNALVKQQKSAGGFIWIHKKGKIKLKIKPFKNERFNGKNIVQLNKNNKPIKEFQSCWTASKELGIDCSNIRNAILNKRLIKDHYYKYKK